MKKIYLSFLLPLAAVCNAQQDMSFETGGQGANYTWNVFENDANPPLQFVANPDPSGVNTSPTVAAFTALVSGNPWAGTETNHDNGMADFVLDAAHSTIKIMVHKSVISPVGIKLVTPTGAALPEKKVSNTVINQWEELTFDFSDQIGAFTEPFDQIVVFPDFTDGPRPATNMIYFDNITFGESDINEPQEPMTAAPDPAVPAADVISMFSGVYTNVPVLTWHTDWSSAALQNIEIQGNPTLKYTGLGYVGIETGNAENPNQIDITGMTHFNVNVWTPNATTLSVKLVDFGPNGVYNAPNTGGDDTEGMVTFSNPAPGQWITYHIPLSSFAGLANKENIAQLLFVSENGATIYVDNIYFSNETVEEPQQPMVAAPDPTIPQAQVIPLFSNYYSNNIPMATWHTDWSSATLQDIQIQGNDTKKYSNLNYVGAEPVSQIDATGMTHFNFNAWSADFTQLRIKLVDFGADGEYDGPGLGDDKEHELTFDAPAQGEWITYNIPLSDFANLTTRGHLQQIILSSNGTSTVFIDNVYFSTDSTAGLESFVSGIPVLYPNPVNDVLTIKGTSAIDEVIVYNTLGQQVYKAFPGTNEAKLSISQLQTGVYIVNATINGASTTQKFIKE